MGAFGIVLAASILDIDLGLSERVKDLPVEAFGLR